VTASDGISPSASDIEFLTDNAEIGSCDNGSTCSLLGCGVSKHEMTDR